MTVNIDINPDKSSEEVDEPGSLKVSIRARRALDGSIIITEHPDIDIVYMSQQKKVVAFAKKSMDDSIYATQSRLFEYLFKRGIVSQESIRGGNVYSSLEADVLTPVDNIPVDSIVVLNISKFIDYETPSAMFNKGVEAGETDRLLDPDSEDSTELGDVPHSPEKGSIIPHQVRRYIQGF